MARSGICRSPITRTNLEVMAVGFLLAGKLARLDFRVGYSTAPVINSEFGVIMGSYFVCFGETCKLLVDGDGDMVVRASAWLVSGDCCSRSRAGWEMEKKGEFKKKEMDMENSNGAKEIPILIVIH